MSKGREKPNFKLQRVYADGSHEEPQIHELADIDNGWTMSRRGFLATTAVGLGALGVLSGGCSRVTSDTVDNKSTDQVKTIDGNCDEEISAFSWYVEDLAVSPDGKMLASVGDKIIKLWSLPSGKLLKILPEHECNESRIAFSPDNKLLISGSEDKTVKIWLLPGGELSKTLVGHAEKVLSIAVSADGRLLASGSFDRTIKLWSLPGGELIKTLNGHTHGVKSVAISPDGKILASGSIDEAIKIWAVPGGEVLKTLKDHRGIVACVAISPDGKLLVSGSFDKTIKLWSLPEGNLRNTLDGHSNQVISMAISPDGKTLVSGAGHPDKPIKIWSLTSGKLLKQLIGQSGSGSLAFSPDSKLLVSSSGRIVKLWSLAEERFLTNLFDPSTMVSNQKVSQYSMQHQNGQEIIYSFPCSSPLPVGATCTCNCVSGAFRRPQPKRLPMPPNYDIYCSCNKICTCVPVHR